MGIGTGWGTRYPVLFALTFSFTIRTIKRSETASCLRLVAASPVSGLYRKFNPTLHSRSQVKTRLVWLTMALSSSFAAYCLHNSPPVLYARADMMLLSLPQRSPDTLRFLFCVFSACSTVVGSMQVGNRWQAIQSPNTTIPRKKRSCQVEERRKIAPGRQVLLGWMPGLYFRPAVHYTSLSCM